MKTSVVEWRVIQMSFWEFLQFLDRFSIYKIFLPFGCKKKHEVSVCATNQIKNQITKGIIWNIWKCMSECEMVPKDFKLNQKITTNKTIPTVILSMPMLQKTWIEILTKLFISILLILSQNSIHVKSYLDELDSLNSYKCWQKKNNRH